MSKQTAVEWYSKEDTELTLLYLANKIKEAELGFKKMELFHKALAMEKEQIEDAYGDALNGHRVNYCDRNDYYNQTYKGGQDEKI
jgi:hypothetical protein